jgi:hypothetical protein
MQGYWGQSLSNVNFNCNENMVDRRNQTNSGQFIHNNIGSNIRSIETFSKNIHVDSTDRDLNCFPSPFKYIVGFGSGNNNKLKIPFDFKNIKTFDLIQVVTPYSNVLLFDKTVDYPLTLSDNEFDDLTNINRHLLFKFPGIYCTDIYSTTDFIRDDTFMLQPSVFIGRNQQTWTPVNSTKVYPNSNLGNLSGNVEIEIRNDRGEMINFYDGDNNENIDDIEEYINSKKNIIENEYSGTEKTNKLENINNLRNSLQTAFILNLGILETNINIKPFS